MSSFFSFYVSRLYATFVAKCNFHDYKSTNTIWILNYSVTSLYNIQIYMYYIYCLSFLEKHIWHSYTTDSFQINSFKCLNLLTYDILQFWQLIFTLWDLIVCVINWAIINRLKIWPILSCSFRNIRSHKKISKCWVILPIN